MFVQSKGRTALLDGVYMAMNEMKKAHNPRKAILIISDGGDNSSRYTQSEVRNSVREADVQIYAIGIFEPWARAAELRRSRTGRIFCGTWRKQTGGRDFDVDNSADAGRSGQDRMELRNQYVIGYSPKNKDRDGKFRRVRSSW